MMTGEDIELPEFLQHDYVTLILVDLLVVSERLSLPARNCCGWHMGPLQIRICIKY